MKTFITYITLCLGLFTNTIVCSAQANNLPRIAIAGIATESSTFSPALTSRDEFRIRTGEAVLDTYPFMVPDSMVRERATWLPSLVAATSPGGAVTREAYESLVAETLDSLKKNGPYDGLYFDIHGAMSVVGLDDPEGDLLARIREVIGTETLVSTSMDLHGNVSWRLAKNTDLITCFRMAPHEDRYETKKRAIVNLLDRLENGKGKPLYKAWVPVPILLPGEKTSTRVEPAKSLYAKIPAIEQQQGVIDAAIWIGYAWADEPRNHAVVMVTGDDRAQVSASAEKLATDFWNVRSQFDFVAPVDSLTGSLNKALASKKHPFFISDSGDNPTAGGAGDVTWTLTKILERPEFKSKNGPSLIYASIPGPDLFKKATAANVGDQIEGHVGAKLDARFAPPLKLNGTIESVGENAVVIRVGSVRVIVSSDRNRKTNFSDLNLKPLKTDIIVVKMGYLVPDLYNMRKDWIMALTPGGVDQDLMSLDYFRINRPMFPFDNHQTQPNLEARLIPASDEFVPAPYGQ
ncbi:M81 family metallopeptidase [Pseudozobellia sp. WGM2]|uniref:M81 family metallopeptidase n=1 Tax=Pseudozobellia sp. WGM2 TaxID=2787625 RepID=UPI001ADEEB30|nr:M81 family metallopeptidase [Pseudozobellia sp. WGM2]